MVIVLINLHSLKLTTKKHLKNGWLEYELCFPFGIGSIFRGEIAGFVSGSVLLLEQCSKPWLVGLYRGLYYPVI